MSPRVLLASAAAVVSATLAFAYAQPATATRGAGATAAKTVPVRLLALNDFHGNLEPPAGSSGRIIDENGNQVDAGGAAYLAAHMRRHTDANTLKVASGDLIGASPLISAAYHDEPAIQLLGDLGVTVSAVGNHEFDEGHQELLRIQNGGCHPVDGCSPEGEWPGAEFRYTGANVLKEKTQKPALPPYVIRKINGVRIGIIGVVTKDTPNIVTSDGIKGLQFIDEVEAANKAAAALRAKGVRAMALLVHEGDSTVPANLPDRCDIPQPGQGTRIATGVDPDIDMVLAGHTHQQFVCTVKDPRGNNRLYTQGASFGRVLTQVDFNVDTRTGDVDRAGMKADNHVVTRDVTPDPEVEKFVALWRERVAPIANRRIGEITADINRAPTPAGETKLGNLIADLQLEAMREHGAQIAVMNPGGIRTDLVFAASGAEGDGVVTYGEAFAVQPFSNVMGVVTLTGRQIDALLEQQWTDAGEKILQPSASLRFTINRAQPAGDRVSAITVDGQPLDEAKTYRVAANSFLIGGGDGFTVFREGTDLVNGPIDLDALTAYFGAHSPIAPPETGRITAAG
jgi:5'-nucleotidase